MKTYKQYVAAALVIVLAAGGMAYWNQNSYAYHLDRAESALAALSAVLKGGKSYQSYFAPAAYAEELHGSVDERAVSDLAKKVVKKTEDAAEAAENINNAEKLRKALIAISKMQEKTIDVLSDAAETVTLETTAEAVAEAIETTSKDQESVGQAMHAALAARQKGKNKVDVDIKTSKDKKGAEKDEKSDSSPGRTDAPEASAEYEAAKWAVENIKAQGTGALSAEEIKKLDSKLLKAKAALDSGKPGMVHGLTTAINAKGKNMLRKSQAETPIGPQGKAQGGDAGLKSPKEEPGKSRKQR